ncbi:MAG TPA: DUF4097 family beta strand repeat-containing protein [Steroidobacteraceae bacterium]|nr:DUF4097 family beta strand repeat-containing protein [Steroidobacteraceae bacterium]
MSTSAFRMAILTASLALAAGAARAGTFQEQVAADPHGEVDISNISGSIEITGWDKPQVAVTADLSGDTQRVRVITGSGHTRVCVAYGSSNGCDSSGWSHGGEPVTLEVQVPQGSQLEVSGVSADIRSHGVTGAQRLHTVSGGIDADLGSGNDEADSVSGTVTLHGSGQDGTLHAASVSGDLRVTNVAGELEARTVNGTLTAELSPARLVRLNTTSGDIELSASLASGGTVETETVSGDQKLEVAAPGGYSYEAKTFSGDIRDCFGQRPDRSEYGPGNHLEGTRGGGHGQVRIQSLSGDVSLCDH